MSAAHTEYVQNHFEGEDGWRNEGREVYRTGSAVDDEAFTNAKERGSVYIGTHINDSEGRAIVLLTDPTQEDTPEHALADLPDIYKTFAPSQSKEWSVIQDIRSHRDTHTYAVKISTHSTKDLIDPKLAWTQVDEEAAYGVLAGDVFTAYSPPTLGQCSFLLCAIDRSNSDIWTPLLGSISQVRTEVPENLQDLTHPITANMLQRRSDLVELIMARLFRVNPEPYVQIVQPFSLGTKFCADRMISTWEWRWFWMHLENDVKWYILREARLKIGRRCQENCATEGSAQDILNAVNAFPTWMNDLKHLFWNPKHTADTLEYLEEEQGDMEKVLNLQYLEDPSRFSDWIESILHCYKGTSFQTRTMIGYYIEAISRFTSTENWQKDVGSNLISFWGFFKSSDLDGCKAQLRTVHHYATLHGITIERKPDPDNETCLGAYDGAGDNDGIDNVDLMRIAEANDRMRRAANRVQKRREQRQITCYNKISFDQAVWRERQKDVDDKKLRRSQAAKAMAVIRRRKEDEEQRRRSERPGQGEAVLAQETPVMLVVDNPTPSFGPQDAPLVVGEVVGEVVG